MQPPQPSRAVGVFPLPGAKDIAYDGNHKDMAYDRECVNMTYDQDIAYNRNDKDIDYDRESVNKAYDKDVSSQAGRDRRRDGRRSSRAVAAWGAPMQPPQPSRAVASSTARGRGHRLRRELREQGLRPGRDRLWGQDHPAYPRGGSRDQHQQQQQV